MWSDFLQAGEITMKIHLKDPRVETEIKRTAENMSINCMMRLGKISINRNNRSMC